MPTKQATLKNKIRRYHLKYLNDKYVNLNESTTRLIVNHLLVDVLGFKELIDIEAEYITEGGVADYLIKIGKKKIIVEVKSLKTTISRKHLNQALPYAVLSGIEWIVITNGDDLVLYKVKYQRPIIVKQLFKIKIRKSEHKLIKYLTRESFIKGSIKELK